MLLVTLHSLVCKQPTFNLIWILFVVAYYIHVCCDLSKQCPFYLDIKCCPTLILNVDSIFVCWTRSLWLMLYRCLSMIFLFLQLSSLICSFVSSILIVVGKWQWLLMWHVWIGKSYWLYCLVYHVYILQTFIYVVKFFFTWILMLASFPVMNDNL